MQPEGLAQGQKSRSLWFN